MRELIREGARGCERVREGARGCERVREGARGCERVREGATSEVYLLRKVKVEGRSFSIVLLDHHHASSVCTEKEVVTIFNKNLLIYYL